MNLKYNKDLSFNLIDNNGNSSSVNFNSLNSNKVLFSDSTKIVPESGVYSFGNFESSYNKNQAQRYDNFNRGGNNKKSKEKMHLNFFQKRVIDKCRTGPILSVGAGTMYWDSKLSISKGLIPLDISKDMLDIAIKKKRTNFAFCADGSNLPFADQQFELVYLFDALPASYGSTSSPSKNEIRKFREVRGKIITEMYRVTKKGGKCCMLISNRNKTDFRSIFRKIKGHQSDNYGFYPEEITKEIRELGLETHYKSYEMNLSPFYSPNLITIWSKIVNLFRINFLGTIYIEILKK